MNVTSPQKELKKQSETVSLFGNNVTMDKIKKYGWKTSGEPGRLEWIHKSLIKVDPLYQRSHVQEKVNALASNFNWLAYGVISVAHREDNSYFAFDGMHRVLAALNRSDIALIPCIVHEVTSLQDEARGFVCSNRNRKPMSIFSSHRANLIAKDPIAIYVQDTLDAAGIILVSGEAMQPKTTKSIAACYRMANESKSSFKETLDVVSLICINRGIRERVLVGMYYLSKNLAGGISNPKFIRRLQLVGELELYRSITEAASYYKHGGDRVWAKGILDAVNHGLRNKFALKET